MFAIVKTHNQTLSETVGALKIMLEIYNNSIFLLMHFQMRHYFCHYIIFMIFTVGRR